METFCNRFGVFSRKGIAMTLFSLVVGLLLQTSTSWCLSTLMSLQIPLQVVHYQCYGMIWGSHIIDIPARQNLVRECGDHFRDRHLQCRTPFWGRSLLRSLGSAVYWQTSLFSLSIDPPVSKLRPVWHLGQPRSPRMNSSLAQSVSVKLA